MYHASWDAFVNACNELCDNAEIQPRYCLRWRHEQGLLVIKVTDDRKCLKFRTRSSVFLNRFDALNRAILARFQNRSRVGTEASAARAAVAAGPSMSDHAPSMPESTAAVLSASTAGPSDAGGNRKKKKGKKKSKA
ncbi:hypothetical protein JCM10212_005948 [Sporobolomyces blumeae]